MMYILNFDHSFRVWVFGQLSEPNFFTALLRKATAGKAEAQRREVFAKLECVDVSFETELE